MVQVEIVAMTFGPYGLGHLDGGTVMVPNTTPGDVVEAEITARRRDFTLARAVRFLRSGPSRRESPCPFLPRCGGCDWQQIEYAAQLRIKAELVAVEFRRALNMEIGTRGLVEAAPAEFGYRSRIRLKSRRGGELGFHELGSNALVAVDNCLVAAPSLGLPTELARLLGPTCDEIEVVADGHDQIIVAHLAKSPTAGILVKVRQLVAKDPQIRGIILRCGEMREAIGATEISLEVEPGCVIEADADLFSQVNRLQNAKLVARTIELADLRANCAVLDLFCGSGNIGLPAARRGAVVTGVDDEPLAIEAARRNAARMGLGATQFIAMNAEDMTRFLGRAGYRPDVVILDPPRTGAPDLMRPVARMGPRRVIYVSCNPATLVRDLRLLMQEGYQLDRVHAFDFFPNTHHVEVVVSALLT
jgi:23S rRNA (uracil1939-C5)-methyltransferase